MSLQGVCTYVNSEPVRGPEIEFTFLSIASQTDAIIRPSSAMLHVEALQELYDIMR